MSVSHTFPYKNVKLNEEHKAPTDKEVLLFFKRLQNSVHFCSKLRLPLLRGVPPGMPPLKRLAYSMGIEVGIEPYAEMETLKSE